MSDYIRFWLKEHKIKTSYKKIHQKNPKTQQQEKKTQKVLQNQKTKHIPRAKFKVHRLIPPAEVLM